MLEYHIFFPCSEIASNMYICDFVCETHTFTHTHMRTHPDGLSNQPHAENGRKPMAYGPLESFTPTCVRIKTAAFYRLHYRLNSFEPFSPFSCCLTSRRFALRTKNHHGLCRCIFVWRNTSRFLGPSPACARWAAINGLQCARRRPAHRMQEEGSGRKHGVRQFDLMH